MFRYSTLEKFYRSAPIGITVEGSNTLTRSLIIFGQGLNKSHPFIYPVLDSILKDDLNEFKKSLNVFNHSLLFAKSFNVRNSLENQIINFANLTNLWFKGRSNKKRTNVIRRHG